RAWPRLDHHGRGGADDELLLAGRARAHRLHVRVRLRGPAGRGQYRPVRPGRGGPLDRAELHPDAADRRAPAGLPRGHRPPWQRPHRPDQEHHHRGGDRRARGLLHDAQPTAEPRRHRDSDLHRLRPVLRRADPARGLVLRLAGQAVGGGPVNDATVLYDVPGPRGRRRNRLLTVLFAVAFAAAAAWVVWALGQKGQWAAQKWKPFLQGDIWTVQILPALVGTLKAAAIAAVLALAVGIAFGL